MFWRAPFIPLGWVNLSLVRAWVWVPVAFQSVGVGTIRMSECRWEHLLHVRAWMWLPVASQSVGVGTSCMSERGWGYLSHQRVSVCVHKKCVFVCGGGEGGTCHR